LGQFWRRISVPDDTLFFATGNGAKLAQLRWIAAYYGCEVRVLSPRECFGDRARYEEVGTTEREIARCGARDVTTRIGVPVLTEDTGLRVGALNGWPGVRAGRYLKAHGRAGLLRELAECEDRRAAIISAVAYATPNGECMVYEHRVPGQITRQERWTPGLPNWIAPTEESVYGGGYNAIFVPDGETRTLAEIPPIEALDRGYREPNFVALLRALGYA
jgi:XTP/dITP diphosphohydrolase